MNKVFTDLQKTLEQDLVTEISTPDGIKNFNLKNDVLSSNFKSIDHYDFYKFIYGDLNRKYKLFIKDTSESVIADDYQSARQYIEDYTNVFTFTAEFKNNYKATYEFLSKMNAFVIDLDHVSCDDIYYIVNNINKSELKPNLIVNSGNGIHLYYIFDTPFDVYGYLKFNVRCHYYYGDADKKLVYLERVKLVFDRLKQLWKSNPAVDYKTDELSIYSGPRISDNSLRW